MLRDSVVVVAVVRTRPRAIPLAMITTRKSIHGFPFLSYMSMGLRLAALRAAGAPLLINLSFRRNKTQTAVINMEPKRMLNKVNFLDVSYVQHTSSEVTVN